MAGIGPLLAESLHSYGVAASSGYLNSAAPYRGLIKWPQLGLSYYIEAIPPTLQPIITMPEVLTALGRWDSLAGQPIFSGAHSVAPQIVVHWDGVPTPNHPYEAGHCRRFVTQQGIIEHAVITIVPEALIDASLTHTQRQHRLLNTLAHELGHALGLEHHIDPKALMHPQGWRNTIPNASDRQQWMRLYRGS